MKTPCLFEGSNILTNIKTNFKFVLTLTVWNQRHRFVYTASTECLFWKKRWMGSRNVTSLMAVWFRAMRVAFFIHGHCALVKCPVSPALRAESQETQARARPPPPHPHGVGGWLWAPLCPSVRWRDSLHSFWTPVQFLPPLSTLRRHVSKHGPFVEKCFFAYVSELSTECKSGHLK